MDTAQLSGRELSGIVGERIMGWFRDADRRGPLSDWHEAACGGEGGCAPSCGFELPRYSESIEAAMRVLDKFDKFILTRSEASVRRDAPYYARLFIFSRGGFVDREAEAWAVSLPEAICRAALAAIEGS